MISGGRHFPGLLQSRDDFRVVEQVRQDAGEGLWYRSFCMGRRVHDTAAQILIAHHGFLRQHSAVRPKD